MKQKLYGILHYLLAFLIPVSIFLFAMYLMDIYPFGDTSMRVIDAISQYPAFFEGLKDGDLFTFKIGLGTNFYTIFTTYLASPLSFLYFFFENYQFDLFFVILVLLKIGLIGLNMNILLNYKKKRNKYSLIFSTIYALSGFVSLYYFNYQFLDALYMLPLIMIGIQKIVEDNKNLMYFISLTLMIIFHYYTAYMICIFSVIYFFFLLVNIELEKKDKKKRTIKFFVTSLFCGLCSSFITIPSIYSLMEGRNNLFYGINYWSFNDKTLSLFYNLTAGSSFGHDISYGTAPSFLTLFIVVLLVFFIFDKNVNKKYKISFLSIYITYILSLSFNLFYYVWHIFQEPIFFPARFVFVFDCFFILIAYNYFIKKDKQKKTLNFKIFVCIIIILLIIISFLYKINSSKGFLFDSRYLILIIFNCLIFVFYVFCHDKKHMLIILTFVFLEILIHCICCFNLLLSLSKYDNLNVIEEKNKIKIINNKLENILEEEKNNFFRMEIFGENNRNPGMLYNYNGVSYFTSLYNYNAYNFLKETYAVSSNNYQSAMYTQPDIFVDYIISLKYTVNLNKDKSLFLQKNSNVINSLGFMAQNSSFGFNEKSIMPILTKKHNVKETNINYELLNNDEKGILEFEYLINEDVYVKNNFYPYNILLNKSSQKEEFVYEVLDIYINDTKVNNFNYLNKGDRLQLIFKLTNVIREIPKDYFKILTINSKEYETKIKDYNENIVTDIVFKYDGFIGNLNVTNEKKFLILTIPYDESIDIYVNGEKHDYKKVFNGIIGLNLEKGEYIIKLRYRVKGLKMGIIISITSFIIFSGLKTLEKKYITRYNNVDNKEEIFK